MKHTAKILFYFVLFWGFSGLFFFLGVRSTSGERNSLRRALKTSRDTILVYRKVIGSQQMVLGRKSTEVMSLRDALKSGELERKRLKEINAGLLRSNTELRAELSVLKDSLENRNVVVRDTITSGAAMVLPALFHFQDNYVSLSVNVSPATWKFRLTADVPVTVTIGDDVVLSTPNPYVTFRDVKTVSIKQKPKFWNKRWVKWAGFGLTAGAFFYLGSL